MVAGRVVMNFTTVFPIPVRFQRQVTNPGCPRKGERVGVLSVLRFIPVGVFDDAMIRTIGKAFDAACKELMDTGQPDVVQEVMIERIIAAARRGERNVTRLRQEALTGLGKPRDH